MQKVRQKIVAGNWKMNLDYPEGLALFYDVINMIRDEISGGQQAIVCSPFIHLHALVQLAKGFDHVSVGAQNVYQDEFGAHTGEISAKMVYSVGARYVILGHSERRQEFGETNPILAAKIDVALKNQLRPIFCIGETLQQREAGEHFEVIKQQLVEALFQLDEAQLMKLILAYEPIWSIGTGVSANAGQAQEMHHFIRQEIAGKYSQEIASLIPIIYGGSCKPANAIELFAKPDIDGGLIGGDSLKARDFVDILKVFN